ncbi:hypothetical protein PYCC9005_002114 [Savitreella phatthalungensis]
MSRTLGFIAGLTLPAGIFYISTLHLRATTDHISSELHDKAARLDELNVQRYRAKQHAYDSEQTTPVRRVEALSDDIRRRWNDAISGGYAAVTNYNYDKLGERAYSAAQYLTGLTAEQHSEAEGKLEKVSENVRGLAHDAGRRLEHEAKVQKMLWQARGEKATTVARDTSKDVRQTASQVTEALADEWREAKQQLGVIRKAAQDKIESISPHLTREPIDAFERLAREIGKNAQDEAKLAKIDAVDRWRSLLDAVDETVADKQKRLLAEVKSKRIGFVQ